MTIVALLTGLLVGALGALLLVRPRLREAYARQAEMRGLVGEAREHERRAIEAEAKLEASEGSLETRVRDAVRTASAEVYAQSNASFLELAGTKLGETVAPLAQSLEKMNVQVQELDRARAESHGALTRQLGDLGQQTQTLSTALRTPHVRGRWGEMQLKRVVELAGMLPYCDFVEQASTTTDDGRLRPDVVVNMPGGKHVVIDAKVPLATYLDALEATDEDVREQRFADHARIVREHVQKLSAKQYWSQFTDSPERVVMFLPDEGFFRAALESDRDLVEMAVRAKVHIASPTTLIALLQAIAHGWQQARIAEDARTVHALGRELYERITVSGSHLTKVGVSLEKAVSAYNDVVGSLERRVLPTARKLGEASLSEKELPVLDQLAARPVALRATELLQPAPDDADEPLLIDVLPGDAHAA